MTVIGWILAVLAGVVFLSLLVALRGAPYVPSRARDVRQAFDQLYSLGPSDVLVDIGSGDGKVLRQAAERGARAIGYEINPLLVVVSWLLSRNRPSVTIKLADFWSSNVPDTTTIIYTFGTGRDIERMADWVEKQANQIGRPLYFMSYGFELARSPLRSSGAHHLYLIEPLQPEQAQV